MKTKIFLLLLLALLLGFLAPGAPQPANLLPNGDFSSGLAGWNPLWTREPNSGEASIDPQTYHSSPPGVKIEFRGFQDWGLVRPPLPVKPGQAFTYRFWVKAENHPNVSLSVTLYDEKNQALNWNYVQIPLPAQSGWQLMETSFTVPGGTAFIQPRIIGLGPAKLWVDDFSLTPLVKTSTPSSGKTASPALELENPVIRLAFHPKQAVFVLRDKRNGFTWSQGFDPQIKVLKARKIEVLGKKQLDLTLLQSPGGLKVRAQIALEREFPEFTITLEGKGRMSQNLSYPPPFLGGDSSCLILPLNEGIAYQVSDPAVQPARFAAYGGGISMPFFGLSEGEKGLLAIIETPDDALVRLDRRDGRLYLAPEWEAQKGQFGYSRKIRYCLFDRGGVTAMAKRYRTYARQTGLLKTLKEKAKIRPQLDKLIGAVILWCWEKDAPKLCGEMQRLGIKRILWENSPPELPVPPAGALPGWQSSQTPEVLKKLNAMGVLTGCYDNYQDVMNPADFQHLSGINNTWITGAWPHDLLLGQDGQWVKGWEMGGTNGKWYPCGAVCDSRALNYAQARISRELQTHPFQSRFLDTATASARRECYSQIHPMTRTQSRAYRNALLNYVSNRLKLVTGSETGIDSAVPYVDYFEGMLSFCEYRCEDSGRDICRIIDQVPPQIIKFQLGEKYRIPLWELVYHDCVVSTWYWGDYNNKFPAVWDKRDLFNLLYGTAPMFMFNRPGWEQYRERFVKSYQRVCPAVRRVGYSEMTGFKILTPDCSVQRTGFSNGITVTVNFGSKAYRMENGKVLKPMDFRLGQK